MLLRNPFFLLSIVTFLRLGSACSSSCSCCAASLAWEKEPTALSYDTRNPRLLGWPLHLGETLWNSKDKKCCLYKTPYVAALLRELHPTRDFLQTHLQENQKVCSVHKWRVSEEIHLVKSRLLHPFSTMKSTSKSGTRKDYLSCLRSPTKSSFKCLFKDTPLWCGTMITNLSNPEDQADRKIRTLCDQPRLMCVTPTALLGSWVL